MNRLIKIALTRTWPFAIALVVFAAACGSEVRPTEPPPTVIPTSPTTGAPATEATLAPTAVATEPVPTEATERSARPAATATVAPPTVAPAEATATAEPTGVAAGPSPTATTPSTVAPTAAPPTEVPRTESPPLPTVDVPAGHPAAVLALLPDSSIYTYINLETVSQRPDLMEHVEFQLAHFVSQDELPFAEELLVSVGAEELLVSFLFRTYQWAMVLLGDFARLSDALRTSAEPGGGLSVSIIDTYREVEIYVLVRTRSSGYESEIYLTVLDSETLAASPDADAIREMIDRHNDGGQLPKGLAAMVENWGLSDFLEAFPREGFDEQGRPIDVSRIFAFHAELADGSTTTFRALQQFDDAEQAAAAAAWLNEQDEPGWRSIGWGSSATIDEWRHRGATVYGEVVLPDEELPGLMQGN